MATTVKNRTNIFSFIPKSVSSETFLVWLFNYFASDNKYSHYQQSLWDSLLLKKEDEGKSVSDIVINHQQNDVELVLTFHFKGMDKSHDILLLFGDKTYDIVLPEQLDRYRQFYPNSYHYIYYKMGYVTSIEEQCVSSNQYDLITYDMIEFVLETIEDLHPLIKMYAEYLNNEGETFNSYYERIFLKHEKDVLLEPAAQKYLLNTLLECNLTTFGTSN